MYKYCTENKILTWKNSGFKKRDSTIYQLVSFVHTLYNSLDKGKQVTTIYLDVSKAFDRVWHRGLLFKLKQIGIEDPLLSWFESYLTNRRQRVVLNGSQSSWYHTNAGVPQGSILGPLLFLIFINDIENVPSCEIRMFADDTLLYDISTNLNESINKINNDLKSLEAWAKQWKVSFNAQKTVSTVFSRTNVIHDPLIFNNVSLSNVSSNKHLGVYLHNTLSWDDHISYIIKKVSNKIASMKRIQHIVPRKCLEVIYTSMIRPTIDYGDVLYPHLSVTQSKRLESIQRQCALICTKAYARTPQVLLLKELGWEELALRRKLHCLDLMFKIKNKFTPIYLQNLCPNTVQETTRYSLRNAASIRNFACKYMPFRNSFFPFTIRHWNLLDVNIKKCNSTDTFKQKLRAQLSSNKNKLFSALHGRPNVHHTRLRLGLSALNSHRFSYGFIPSPSCLYCNFKNEDTGHYLFECPAYAASREEMFAGMKHVINENHYVFTYINSTRNNKTKCIKFMLYGDENESFENNVKIFRIVQIYIYKKYKPFSIEL